MYVSKLTYIFSFRYSLVVHVVVGVYIQGHVNVQSVILCTTLIPFLNFSVGVLVCACGCACVLMYNIELGHVYLCRAMLATIILCQTRLNPRPKFFYDILYKK